MSQASPDPTPVEECGAKSPRPRWPAFDTLASKRARPRPQQRPSWRNETDRLQGQLLAALGERARSSASCREVARLAAQDEAGTLSSALRSARLGRAFERLLHELELPPAHPLAAAAWATIAPRPLIRERP